jgi:protein-S-isoprenylcysteine O-methyltransferase Ste14
MKNRVRTNAKLASRFVLALAAMILILFLPAGTLRFWEAWVYLGILFALVAGVVIYFAKYDPDALARRMRLKEKETVQKKFIIFGDLLFLAACLLVGFDRRWNWSSVPVVLVFAADAMVVIGYGIFVRVLWENRYLSRTVEVEKGQTVITTGPYAVVRHPMYAGVILLYLFTPLALGSFWSLIPFGIMIAAFPVRILNEEKVLLRDLDGYRAYTGKTRFRLIPGIW